MNIKETLAFESNLYNLINTCGLPVSTAFYVLKSVYLDFQKTFYECAEKENTQSVNTQEIYEYPIEEKKETEENE